MSGAGYHFPGGPKAIAADATQDWAFARTPDGKLVARPEGEFTWRDEEDGIQLYILISPTGRGAKLDTLNRSGLVMVEIKEKLLRVTVLDVMHKVTCRYQWLNLWGAVVPEKSRFHLSQDNKRIVVWLHKKYTTREAGDWGDILDVRRGKYNRSTTGWPGILLEVQGAWRSEDEEPIEVLGDQVVWPEGSRDLLIVDEETEEFRLVQAGDGEQVLREEFRGIYERQSHRLKWEDGDAWTRIPGLALKRQAAEKDVLPLEYDQTLARWVPWLPPDELRRQSLHWMPPSSAEAAVEVRLLDGDAQGADVKRELMGSVEDEEEEDEAEEGKKAPKLPTIADFDFLPAALLLKCRVCALAAQELDGAGFVQTLLALRDRRRVSLENEAAALGGLEKWLQWLRPWLAPGARGNVEGALEAIKERLFEVLKEERRVAPDPRSAARDRLGCGYDRWPPLWSCTLAKPNDLLKAATEELVAELRRGRAEAGKAPDPRRAFADARRRIGERLFESQRVEAGSRRCDPLERRWARRYAEDASKALLDAKRARHLRQDLRELGLAVVEDALDWGTLVKVHGEVLHLLVEGKAGGEPLTLRQQRQLRFFAARGGHVRWAQVWTSKLEELGMTGLAAASAFMQQLAFRLSEWEFGKCRWRSVDDPVLWFDDGRPLELGRQAALEWAEPSQGDAQEAPLGQEVEDDLGDLVPPERRIMAFLFLNTPAWLPEWGGALRCHLPQQVQRDVWGDGGRLVLLREVQRYELLPSHHSHAVLMLRLRGAAIASAPVPPRQSLPEPVPVEDPRTQVEEMCPDDQHKYLLRKKVEQAREIPESYHRCLSEGEVQALAEVVGVETELELEPSPEEAAAAAPSAAEAEARSAPSAGEPQEPDDGAAAVPAAPEKPPRLQMDSHQVIKLFETSFPSAFKLD